MSVLDQLTSDLSWRESELGSLKVLLARKDISTQQQAVLLRASWAMLYAHYEGFIKTALTVFFDQAQRTSKNCGSLPLPTRSFAMSSALKSIRSLPVNELLGEIDSFDVKYNACAPTFPDVDTKSNLWANVLSDLLVSADLKVPYLEEHKAKLNTLVERRNRIAHGNFESITEISYYFSYETAVYDLMYDLAYQIDERLKLPPYS